MKKILLVEDSKEVRENTAELLELSNYEVATAVDGKDGVRMAKDIQPDLIICDIMMPELDGYGVLRMLNKDPETAHIPFIFLTAKSEMADLRRGMKLGADDYLTKPFDEVELLDAIEMRLQKSEGLQKDYSRDLNGLNSFFDDARARDALRALAEQREVRQYNAGDVIFSEGGFPHALYFVVSGKVKSIKTNVDAKDYVTNLYRTGDFMGYLPLLDDQNYNQTAVALEDSELAIIPRDDFYSLLYDNRDVSNRFIKLITDSLREKEERLLHLAYDTVRKRVADALLKLYERYQQDNGTAPFRMSVTRDTLAGMVGTSKECVIRVLSEFKEDGILTTRQSEITLLKPDNLREVRW